MQRAWAVGVSILCLNLVGSSDGWLSIIGRGLAGSPVIAAEPVRLDAAPANRASHSGGRSDVSYGHRDRSAPGVRVSFVPAERLRGHRWEVFNS
jgi:hypothetical protein